MKFQVTVTSFEKEPDVDGADVYQQVVDGESFDLAALIQAVNRKKRGPRVRGKKAAEA